MSTNRRFFMLPAIVLGIAPASWGGLIVDSFEDANEGSWPITRATPGSTVVDDVDVTGVLGGWRRTSLFVALGWLGVPAVDHIDLDVSASDGILDYASTVDARGSLTLWYDGGPSVRHLHADLSGDALIRINFSHYDFAGGTPMEVDILLDAGRPPTAYQARSLIQAGPQSLDFPFVDFDSDIQYIDLSDVQNIVVSFRAPPGVDFRVDQISTVIPEPATLGFLGVGGLLLMKCKRRLPSRRLISRRDTWA